MRIVPYFIEFDTEERTVFSEKEYFWGKIKEEKESAGKEREDALSSHKLQDYVNLFGDQGGLQAVVQPISMEGVHLDLVT